MKVPKDEIQLAFNFASEAINGLEEEIRKKHKPPFQNIKPEEYELIGIPWGYIRSAAYFRNQFSLKKIISKPNRVDNIAYALMQNDMYDYIIHRFGIFGIVKTLFYKAAIINIHSIVEAILYSSCDTLNSLCRIKGEICKKSRTCPFYIKSAKGQKFDGLVTIVNENLKVEFDIESITFLKSLRDNIHIQHITYSEWKAEKIYTYDHYTLGIKVLRQIKDDLPNRVTEFIESRSLGCTNKLKTTATP